MSCSGGRWCAHGKASVRPCRNVAPNKSSRIEPKKSDVGRFCIFSVDLRKRQGTRQFRCCLPEITLLECHCPVSNSNCRQLLSTIDHR